MCGLALAVPRAGWRGTEQEGVKQASTQSPAFLAREARHGTPKIPS